MKKKKLFRVVMTAVTDTEWFVMAYTKDEAERIGPALDGEHGQEEIVGTRYRAFLDNRAPEKVRHLCAPDNEDDHTYACYNESEVSQ
jgi:hypothetical protein